MTNQTKDYANELEREEYIIIDKKISKQNPSREDYEDLQEKLEEIKNLLEKKTARDNLSIVLNSPLTPLSVKQFLCDNKVTAINFTEMVFSPDFMAIAGQVVELISKDKDFGSLLVFEMTEGFLDMYGEGCTTAEDLFRFDNVELSTAKELFLLFYDSFNRNEEFQVKKITMQQLEKDENVLKNIYSTCSEVCEGEFADYLYDNMKEFFEKPLDIALTSKAIQDFRSWGADDEEKEIFAEINYIQDVEITDIKWDSDGENLSTSLSVNVPMSIFDGEDKEVFDQVVSNYLSDLASDATGYCHMGFSDTFDENMYFINEYHDYMYADGKYVEAGVRVGIEKNGELLLDKGIYFADNARTNYLKK